MTTAAPANIVPFPPTYSTVDLPLDHHSAPSPMFAFGASTPTADEKKDSTEPNHIERVNSVSSETDKASYIRDPSKLIAYLIPFPTPKGADDKATPVRFLIWTPPPPPLRKPAEGEKETFIRKTQRKWQNQLRQAKTNQVKGYTWKNGKGKVIKAHNWAFNKVTSADLEFVNRIPIPADEKKDKSKSKGKGSTSPNKNNKALSPTSSNSNSGSDDGHSEIEPDEETKKALRLDEIVLVYPPSIGLSETQLRTEFIESLARTRSKAQRDAMISTGLLPFSLGADRTRPCRWTCWFLPGQWRLGGSIHPRCT